MWTIAFWKATTERAVKSSAQGVVVFWGVGDGLLNLWTVDAGETAGVALGMGVVSVLTSLITGAATGSPSAFKVEIPAGDVEVVKGDEPGVLVAGPASPLPNETPVTVAPVTPSLPDDRFYR